MTMNGPHPPTPSPLRGRGGASGTKLTFRANRVEGRHGWLRLTPAYSVHLVREIVQDLSATDRVLDPFCGTGTTALVCAEVGIRCDTVDINPFLVWLANAKCTQYLTRDAEEARDIVDRALRRVTVDGLWTPPLRDIEKWWDAATLSRLATVFDTIETAAREPATRDLLRVIFCRAAIALSKASFRHQSMSFQRGGTQTAPPQQIDTVFNQALDTVLVPAAERLELGLGRAVLGDARDLQGSLSGKTYNAVITSPPYPNRMSYVRELRPYMYWLGYLETGRQAGELDWKAIGGTWGCATSNLMRWSPETDGPRMPPSLTAALNEISGRSPVLGRYIAKYLYDTDQHIASLRTVLAPGARVIYIVGNSRFYDTMLPTEQIYADLLALHGFTNPTIETLRKRTSKRELFEFAVSATAP